MFMIDFADEANALLQVKCKSSSKMVDDTAGYNKERHDEISRLRMPRKVTEQRLRLICPLCALATSRHRLLLRKGTLFSPSPASSFLDSR